jgi:ectoine hydroxylase-related dioxygenase (phytanoyl-CoA dioxygenase family)
MSIATVKIRTSIEGFSIISGSIDSETIDYLIAQLSSFQNKGKNISKGKDYGVRDILNLVPKFRQFANSDLLMSLIKPILGNNARVVRGIFFDKLPEANWKVPWHQDLTIAVRDRIDTLGYSPWSIKNGIVHVRPPVAILERMLAVRVHLDDADEFNGALKVIPKTHLQGRLSADKIKQYISTSAIVDCTVKRGDIMLMHPLLLHSSSASLNPSHRRVLHFEYSSAVLDGNLRWYEDFSGL